MNQDREKWIDGVMGSLAGARKAEPPADLFDRINRQLDQQQEVRSLSRSQWRLAAAAAILLLLLNMAALQKFHAENEKAGSVLPPIVAEFNLYK